MAFRFIHTADIHLDSPLKSLAMRNAELAAEIGNATRQAFQGIVDLCLAESVDALLISGDLYDGNQTSMNTARFLADQLARLSQAEIRVFIIRGNHDAQSRITKQLVLPETITVFGSTAGIEHVFKDGWNIAIHGISFVRPHSPDSLLSRFSPPEPDSINIGMLHTSLGGAEGHDPYSPCSIQDLQGTGFDYWALGHIHKRSEQLGETTIVMPGIPQGRDIGESGPKSATLVTIDDSGNLSMETRETSVARFERIAIQADDVIDWNDLISRLGKEIQTAATECDIGQLVLRPTIVGRTELAWMIRRDLDLLMEEAIRSAESIGRVWIEKLDNKSTKRDNSDSSNNPIIELARLINDQDAFLPQLNDEVEDYVKIFLKAIPANTRDILGSSDEERHAIISDLLREGGTDVVALLGTDSERDKN